MPRSPFRIATEGDLLALTELERDANLAALSHVFPPERFPFPFDEVLGRWRLVLDDPAAVVLVLDSPDGGLLAYTAHDDTTLRHLAVRPDRWGGGLGRTAVAVAVAGIAATGCTGASLWALVDNRRARALYAALGWLETDDVREAVWPPHPVESRWVLPLPSQQTVPR